MTYMANGDNDERWTNRGLQHPGLIIKRGQGVHELQEGGQ